MKQVVHAACPHDCPDACGVLITVDGGKAVKIQGDPAHPVTRGFLCAKVAKYLDRVYSPDRMLHPMRRVGPKGTPNRVVRTVLSEQTVGHNMVPTEQRPDRSVRPTQSVQPAFERITW